MTQPKPPQLTPENAARFQDQSLVEVYHYRLSYPPAVFDRLLALLTDLPRRILDVGTGTGDLARGLVEKVEQVDAIDVSAAMIERGKQLPNGQHPHLRWMLGRMEDAQLQAPYGLIMGGDSLHWMDWEVVFPLFHNLLHPQGYVVIIERGELPTAWEDGLRKLIVEYSLYKNFQPYNLIDELEKRHLFQVIGRETTVPVASTQSIDDYIASFHSRGSLSTDAMTAEAVTEFDARLRSLIEPHSENGQLKLRTEAIMTWGRSLINSALLSP
jgi:ubiquinone/menaquinone biosynthesis C-methylase UbiE